VSCLQLPHARFERLSVRLELRQLLVLPLMNSRNYFRNPYTLGWGVLVYMFFTCLFFLSAAPRAANAALAASVAAAAAAPSTARAFCSEANAACASAHRRAARSRSADSVPSFACRSVDRSSAAALAFSAARVVAAIVDIVDSA